MKKLLITLATIGLAFPAPMLAEVDPKIAEFCLKARDFEGCVNRMTRRRRLDSESQDVIRQAKGETWYLVLATKHRNQAAAPVVIPMADEQQCQVAGASFKGSKEIYGQTYDHVRTLCIKGK